MRVFMPRNTALTITLSDQEREQLEGLGASADEFAGPSAALADRVVGR
jgi:hypothetical protein